MAKRRASRYLEGRRTREWLKLKTHGEQEFVVAGYTRGAGRRAGTFGSLVLAVRDGDEWRYVGNVGTGFDDDEIRKLLKLLKPLHRDTSPFAVAPKMPKVRKGDVQWVEPELVAEVRFGEWTYDGHLRHPAYLGLRDDKPADDVVREEPPDELPAVIRRGKRELRLSNLDKPFWPDEGITKGDLLRYYRDVADVVLPHIRQRPFTMRRYPDGAYGKAFFQKDAPSHMPDWIPRFRALVSTRDSGRTKRWIEFPVVDDALAILWMVNMGCIDLNAWYSRVDKPERPDFVLFDLDPTPEVPWSQTIEVALILKDLLGPAWLHRSRRRRAGRASRARPDQAPRPRGHRSFAELVAGAIARTHPKLATTEWSKARRRGVLIDANRTGKARRSPPRTPCGRSPAPSSRLPWLGRRRTGRPIPAIFTMEVVRERVRTHGYARGDALYPAVAREGAEALA